MPARVACELTDPGLLDHLDLEHSDTFWGLCCSPHGSESVLARLAGEPGVGGSEIWLMVLVFPEKLSRVDG